jgi:anaplastic lymphoma kinase
LLEVVPPVNLGGTALRGHVSIDNLRMRNCFAEAPRKEACSTSQIKCNESRIAVCIDNARICDLVEDCDEAEDESLNCGELLIEGQGRAELKFCFQFFRKNSVWWSM